MKSIEHVEKDKLAETIKRAKPVAWQNINLKGKCLFAEAMKRWI